MCLEGGWVGRPARSLRSRRFSPRADGTASAQVERPSCSAARSSGRPWTGVRIFGASHSDCASRGSRLAQLVTCTTIPIRVRWERNDDCGVAPFGSALRACAKRHAERGLCTDVEIVNKVLSTSAE